MKDEENLEKALVIILQYRNALTKGNDIIPYQVQLENLLDDTDGDAYDIIEEALASLAMSTADTAIKDIGKILSEMQPLSKGFEIATQIANDGKEQLFFPKAAGYLAQVSGLLKELNEAGDQIQQNVENIIGKIDVSDVSNLLDEIDTIKKEFGEIEDTLTGLKEGFEET